MGVGVGRLGQGIVGYVRSVVHPFSRKWGHVMGKKEQKKGGKEFRKEKTRIWESRQMSNKEETGRKTIT